MKVCKNFLRKIDIFGVSFNFKYKTKDKYSTPFGGFFLLLFGAFGLAFGVYYLLPFINRKNLRIIYYTMNIPKTESIRLKDSQAAFGIGLDCEANDRTSFTPYDVFTLEIKYVLYIKDMQGKYHKDKKDLPIHNCEPEDFYGQYNDSFQYLNLKKYYCLDDYDQSLEGIFSDQVFSYYEFSVLAKDKTNLVEKYLMNTDCKLQMYYTDITIDLFNYKEPIKPFLNALFVQLDPTLFIKRNVYFMNQYLYDDDMIIQVFDEEQKPKQIETLFSRYEEYSLYEGLSRESNEPLYIKEYAKIYVRADTKKTEIRRTYQKLTEFFADSSSFIIAIYNVLEIVFSFIDNFYGEQAIIRKLFIFKGIDNKYFRFSRKSEQINRLVTLTSKKNEIDFKPNAIKLEFNDIHFNTNVENAKNDIKDNSVKELISGGSTENKLKIRKIKVNKEKKNLNTIFTNENVENANNETSKRRIKNIRSVLNLKEDEKNNDINDVNTLEKEESKNRIKDNVLNKTTEYSFNFFEVIVVLLFPCCLKGKLKIKNYMNEKAINLLYSKLNIILYVRNMILFDIMNKTILDESKKDIINFLSRPILSLRKNNFEGKDIFYEGYKEDDFDKFYEEFVELSNKQNKLAQEKRLLVLSKQQLKELV